MADKPICPNSKNCGCRAEHVRVFDAHAWVCGKCLWVWPKIGEDYHPKTYLRVRRRRAGKKLKHARLPYTPDVPSPTEAISFCCILRNRAANFRRMIASLAASMENEPLRHQLVVADYGSDDIDLEEEFSLHSDKMDCIKIPITGSFTWFRGRKTAAEASSRNIMFFIEADMTVPAAFCSRIRKNVGGGMAYFPTCYCLHEGRSTIKGNSRKSNAAHGWWYDCAYGLSGFMRRDYEHIGGWNGAFVRRGGGDNDLFFHAVRCLVVRRERCPGLLHHFHGRRVS